MAYDTPIGSNASKISELPLKQQLKVGFLDMGKRSWSSAKNFGVLGGMYTAFECSVESVSRIVIILDFDVCLLTNY